MHRLFYANGSPYARIVRIAVAELDLDDRIAIVETALRDPASTLLPFNAVGRVPSLVLEDGTVLTETALILCWLDRVSGRPPLLPVDGADGWRGLAAYGRVTGMLDGIAVWNRELRRPEHERSPGVIALETTRVNRVADALEAEAAGGAHAGDGVDAARIALACSGANRGTKVSARREIGGWMRMQEPHVEGVADNDGPESCADAREGGGEALTGETAGWVLSREILKVQGADAVEKSGRQHGAHRHGEVRVGPARSKTPGTRGHHPHGNREIHGLPGMSVPGRGGKASAALR